LSVLRAPLVGIPGCFHRDALRAYGRPTQSVRPNSRRHHEGGRGWVRSQSSRNIS
jgi:hypothetical protein